MDAGLLLALGLTLVGVLGVQLKPWLWALALLLAVGLAQGLSRWLPVALGEGLLGILRILPSLRLALAIGTLQRVLFLGA